MTEPACNEALTDAQILDIWGNRAIPRNTDYAIAFARAIESETLRLARQRRGWVWVQIPPPSRCAMCSAEVPWAFAWTMPHTCMGMGSASLAARSEPVASRLNMQIVGGLPCSECGKPSALTIVGPPERHLCPDHAPSFYAAPPAALIAEKDAEIERLSALVNEALADRDEWKQQHENLLSVKDVDVRTLVERNQRDRREFGEKMLAAMEKAKAAEATLAEARALANEILPWIDENYAKAKPSSDLANRLRAFASGMVSEHERGRVPR